MSMMRLPLTTWAQFVVGVLGLLSFPGPRRRRHPPALRSRRSERASIFRRGFSSEIRSSPTRAERRFSGSTCSGSSAIPRSTSSCCPRWASPPTSSRPSAEGPSSATGRWSTPSSSIGVLSFVVWGHHMFVSGMSPFLGSAFVSDHPRHRHSVRGEDLQLARDAVAGEDSLHHPMLFALGIVSLFVTGGLTGVFLGTNATDIQLHDTYFVVAHFHFIMAGGRPLRSSRRGLLLVPEDVRPLHERGPGEGAFLAHLRRLLRDVLPHALSRHRGNDAPDLRPEYLRLLEASPAGEHLHHHRGVHPRGRAAHLRRQLLLEHVQGQEVHRVQSLGVQRRSSGRLRSFPATATGRATFPKFTGGPTITIIPDDKADFTPQWKAAPTKVSAGG